MEQRLLGKTVLVTGGAGFIGSHLVDKLILEGAKVVVIDNFSSGNNRNENVQYIQWDIQKPEGLLFDGIDYVFHVGAWGRMPMCMEDPLGAYQNNVIGSLNVLEAARKAGVKKVILSSSCIVYCEDTPYKGSKLAMEELAKIYSKSYDVPTICLRYANVYGTRQNIEKDSAMFAMLRKSFNEKGSVDIFGDGEQTRDWIHVDDVCEANILSALSDYQGELDICTGRSLSLNRIVKEILKIPANHIGERKGDAKHINMSPIEAKMAIDFWAKIPLEQGIREIWS